MEGSGGLEGYGLSCDAGVVSSGGMPSVAPMGPEKRNDRHVGVRRSQLTINRLLRPEVPGGNCRSLFLSGRGKDRITNLLVVFVHVYGRAEQLRHIEIGR